MDVKVKIELARQGGGLVAPGPSSPLRAAVTIDGKGIDAEQLERIEAVASGATAAIARALGQAPAEIEAKS